MQKTKLTIFLSVLTAIAVALVLFTTQIVFAKDVTRLRLNQTSVDSGYTIKYDNDYFLLGINPGVFSRPVSVKVEKYPKELPSIEGKKKVSGLYSYYISHSGLLEKPIAVKVGFWSDKNSNKSLYVWDKQNENWKQVASYLNYDDRTVKSSVHFPSAIVAVFEDEQENISKNGNEAAPPINARAISVIDDETGQVLYEHNQDMSVSIASLTKIMTALVFLETNTDFNKFVTIEAGDDTIPLKLDVSSGDVLRVKDLFYATLTGSRNNAANALARSTGLPREEFVARMNEKASKLGMAHTHFNDVSGLDSGNVSTSSDYAKLARSALRDFRMLQGTTTKHYAFMTLNNQRIHNFNNTNKLLNSALRITGSKTGFTYEAGYCLMTKAKNEQGHDVIVVAFGSPTFNASLASVENAMLWAFRNFSWGG